MYFFSIPILIVTFFVVLLIAGIPIALIGLTLVLILMFVVMILDGPILFTTALIGLLVFMAGTLLIIMSPFIFVISGILIPFDKVFYAWVAIMIFVILWEFILPLFGFGLQQKEI